MSSNPEDTGSSPTGTGTTPGPTTPKPGSKPEEPTPGMLKRAAKGLTSNVGNQLASNLTKPGEAKKDDKDKKPEDLMKLVDSLAKTVGDIQGGVNSFLGSAIQKGFDSIVAKVKGDNPSEPSNTDPAPTTPSTTQTTPRPTQNIASDTTVKNDSGTTTPMESTNPTLKGSDLMANQSSPTPQMSALSSDTVSSDLKESLQSTGNDQFPQDSGQGKDQTPEPIESLDSGPSGPPM